MQYTTNRLEAITGAFILGVTCLCIWLFMARTSSLSTPQTYRLSALFHSVEGLANESPVHLAGVRIGTVRAIRLNPTTFMAEVEFDVQAHCALPQDSTATVASRSLLGGKILRIKPGMSETTMPPGSTIIHTESPLSIEDAIGQFIFGQGQKPHK